MKRASVFLLLTALLFSTAPSLFAEDDLLSISGTSTLRYGAGVVRNDFGEDLDRVYREAILDLDFTYSTLRLNVVSAILHKAELPDARPDTSRIQAEDLLRYSLEWQGPVTLVLGQTWTTFGNGMALSLYRDDELENPRLTGTIREELPTTWDSGAEGLYGEAWLGEWNLKGLLGTSDYYGDMGAFNVEGPLNDHTSLGASLVRVSAVPEDMSSDLSPELELDIREIYATLLFGGAELTLNHVDQHQIDELQRNAGAGGLATYASLGLPLKDWWVQTEYKYYRFARRALYMNNAPIVQSEIPTRLLARKRRQTAFEDEVGFRVQASRYFEGGHELVFSSALASHIEDSALMPRLSEAFSTYREYTAAWNMEFDHEHHLNLVTAYSEETRGFVAGSEPSDAQLWYRRFGLGASALFPVAALGPVELNAEFMRKSELEHDEKANSVLLWADVFPIANFSLNATLDYEEHSDAGRDWMASTELRYDFKAGFFDNTLTVFAGRLRGGLVCSSGNCRIVAPFDGVKLTLLSRL
jgi:hypothetical protein